MSLALYWSAVAAELARLMTWRDWVIVAYLVFGVGFWTALIKMASTTHAED